MSFAGNEFCKCVTIPFFLCFLTLGHILLYQRFCQSSSILKCFHICGDWILSRHGALFPHVMALVLQMTAFATRVPLLLFFVFILAFLLLSTNLPFLGSQAIIILFVVILRRKLVTKSRKITAGQIFLLPGLSKDGKATICVCLCFQQSRQRGLTGAFTTLLMTEASFILPISVKVTVYSTNHIFHA